MQAYVHAVWKYASLEIVPSSSPIHSKVVKNKLRHAKIRNTPMQQVKQFGNKIALFLLQPKCSSNCHTFNYYVSYPHYPFFCSKTAFVHNFNQCDLPTDRRKDHLLQGCENASKNDHFCSLILNLKALEAVFWHSCVTI